MSIDQARSDCQVHSVLISLPKRQAKTSGWVWSGQARFLVHRVSACGTPKGPGVTMQSAAGPLFIAESPNRFMPEMQHTLSPSRERKSETKEGMRVGDPVSRSVSERV